MKEKEKVSILDANIFLIGIDFNLITGILYTTPKIIEEINVRKYSDKNRNILNKIQAAIDSRKLNIRIPSNEYLDKVEEKSKFTGEYKALSVADIELVALGLELFDKTKDEITIYTNDYSMENLCAELGIKFSSIHKNGIAKKIMWEVYCSFCNKTYDSEFLNQNCEKCGLKLKRRRKEINREI